MATKLQIIIEDCENEGKKKELFERLHILMPKTSYMSYTYLIHISIISSKDLYNTKQRPPVEQANGKVTSPTHVRYLFGTCPVEKRTCTEQVPNL